MYRTLQLGCEVLENICLPVTSEDEQRIWREHRYKNIETEPEAPKDEGSEAKMREEATMLNFY